MLGWLLLAAACDSDRDHVWDPDDPFPWLSYEPPDGWQRHDPGPAIIESPAMKTFVPTQRAGDSKLRVIVHDATDFESRMDRVGELYWRACLRRQRNLRLEAKRRGKPVPASTCRRVTPSISGFEEVVAVFEQGPRDRGIKKRIIHFVRRQDGRRFRIDYEGDDAEFDQHRESVLASFETLRFVRQDPAPGPSRQARIDSLREQLDGNKLWLYDGAAAGARLTDEDLELLREPSFAGVESLNLFSGHAAGLTGLELGDAGLVNVAHLPLTFLCLRGTLVTDAGLAKLAGLPLQTLVLDGTLVEGDGLRHLSGMPLENLDLARTGVDDASLPLLRGLPLRSLDLRSTAITDAGLAHLKDLGLFSLVLSGTDISEAGLAALGAGGVRYALIPKHVPEEAVARLRERFPDMDLMQ
jgi:hypothetical protein